MSLYKRGEVYWYKFYFRGVLIRRSTRQSNNRVARQMESAHRAAMAKGEVGINPACEASTVEEFIEELFKPYVESSFSAKPNTQAFYKRGIKCLLECKALAAAPLNAVSSKIPEFVAMRQRHKPSLSVRTINCELEVLRRILRLAVEWGKSDKAANVRMLPGENHREYVLSTGEEQRYFAAAPPLLKEVATILLDCGLRPDECFRLRRENIDDDAIQILRGKTLSARRRVLMTSRAKAVIDMRLTAPDSEWVFPAPTRSGHIEKSSLRKQHRKACKDAKVLPFPLYTFRHTCLTRWAAHMDAFTLAYLAGHTDMATTRRYVHPQDHTVKAAMERAAVASAAAGTGHNSGHSA